MVVTGSLSHGSQPLVNNPPTTLWSSVSAVTGAPIDLGEGERQMLSFSIVLASHQRLSHFFLLTSLTHCIFITKSVTLTAEIDSSTCQNVSWRPPPLL